MAIGTGVGDGYAMNRIYDTASYGGYGYGSSVGNGILFNQNQQINRDVLKGTCDTAKGVLEMSDIIHSTNAAQSLQEEMRINQLEQHNNTRFVSLDNKIDAVSKDIRDMKISDLQTDKIMQGQMINRLENEVRAFCCPKPGAVYQPLTCANIVTPS